MILPRAYGFIFSHVLAFFPFYGLAKFKGLHDYALIGIKNIKNMGVFLRYIITRGRVLVLKLFIPAYLFSWSWRK